MGYAVPTAKFGYCATDTTMYKDTTEYTTTSATEELLLTLTQIEQIDKDSTLRFKCDAKMDAGSVFYVFVLRDENGDLIGTIANGADVVYKSWSGDLPASGIGLPVWKKGGEIKVYGYAVNPGKAYIKNIEIAGNRTPYLEV